MISDYSITAGSRVCVITAGARQREGENRLSLVQRNVEIFCGIIPQLIKYSPDTILMVVANPVDVMTYVTWKLSGLPHGQVFGSGTNIDRFIMSERLNIAPSSCRGRIIGEHVAVWGSVNVAGVALRDMNPEIGTEKDAEKWTEIRRQVIDSAYEIIKLKGYTSWAIGLSVATIVQSIMHNSRNIFALSVNVKEAFTDYCILVNSGTGMHEIDGDVYLSLPAVLGENGITHIVRQLLIPEEMEQLQKSAHQLLDVQNSLKL